jgi:hypothetical protein
VINNTISVPKPTKSFCEQTNVFLSNLIVLCDNKMFSNQFVNLF